VNAMKYVFTLLVFCLLVSPIVHAQSYLEFARSDVKKQKIETITKEMNFSPVEDGKFWPVYREYQFDLDKINDKVAILINDYLQNSANLSDKKAKELIARSLSLKTQELKLKDKFFKNRFQKVVNAASVAKLMQIENRLELMVDLKMADLIPLAK